MKRPKPRFKVGQRVMITRCEGVILDTKPLAPPGTRGSMFYVSVGGVWVPCYREEIRPLTKRERGE